MSPTRKQPTQKPPRKPALGHLALMPQLEAWFRRALAQHFPDDRLSYALQFMALPTDTPDEPWLPTVLLHVHLLPVGDQDGLYLTQLIPPFGLNQAQLDEVTRLWAERTETQRAELRSASQARSETEPDDGSQPLVIPVTKG